MKCPRNNSGTFGKTTRQNLRYAFFRWVLPWLAATVIRLLRLTWRVRLVGPEPIFGDRPLVFCFWHGLQAGLFAHYRLRPVTVLASRSRDGALQARILEKLGFQVLIDDYLENRH